MLEVETARVQNGFEAAAAKARAIPRQRKRSGSRDANGKVVNHRTRGQHHRVEAKKGGAGGKGTWGVAGDELGEDGHTFDPRDPIFDPSDGDTELVESRPEFTEEEIRQAMTPCLKEYFQHAETHECVDLCSRINFGSMTHLAAEIPISMALEMNDAACELTSKLIATLQKENVLDHGSTERAFESLLSRMKELKMDAPHAAQILAKFIARAVADDCLAPCYVTKHPVLTDKAFDRDVASCIFKARHLLTRPHSMSRLDQVWGFHGEHQPVEETAKQIKLLLDEYFDSNDKEEAHRCLQELGVPHFYHELVLPMLKLSILPPNVAMQAVYQLVLAVLDNGHSERHFTQAGDLIDHLIHSGLLTSDQISIGLHRIFENLTDLSIDIPKAPAHLETFLNLGQARGFVSSKLRNDAPTKQSRKRYLSQNDGGKIKAENEHF